MIRTASLALIALVLSACGGVGPTQSAATNAERVRAQVATDMAPAYADIAAFCLTIIEGRATDSNLLTRNGFRQTGSRYERTWSEGSAKTGLRIRERQRSPRGCSVDTLYNTDFTLTPFESAEPMRTAWVAYLEQQGFEVSEAERDPFVIQTKDGDPIAEFNIGLQASGLQAIRGDLRIKIATYSNGTRTAEYMQIWE